uniref:Chaperone SurA n=1 Tax=Candidatus Kentrum eta TaxID=2126337 RepID=A0A450UPY3_9GAMM|nr:MAG: periplasmic chaperone for outer membrane proteins SurA [Candidatus Kentron sp. H]VFJ95175.1 MAG: periplasmic chaperone for outer membrane proteins SurA [Candidatus Kentron sp. H]VFK01741.1 MAG: periplasmic chaperone for outer membrane proteins SurA [Candidatus Kentron sp. H]
MATITRPLRTIALFLPLLLSFLPALGAPPLSPPPVTEIDRIVAVVGDDVIVASELDSRIRTILTEMRQGSASVPSASPALRKQVLERLILNLLQVQVARRAGIRVDDERLNRAIAGIARRNGLKLRQFREVLEKDGYDFASFRKSIRDQMMITEIQKRRVANRVQVTDREIDDYLSTKARQGETGNAYHLAHILIAVEDSTDANQVAGARKKVERVIRELRAGADFTRMAMTLSDGRQALEGGDLGWRKEKQLPSLFVDVVPKMGVGQISDPLWNSSGFHILKLVDLRGRKRHIITQTKARHILVRTNEITSNTDAKTRLEQIRERVVQGEDFEELARSHSDDRGTAIKGGDLGWVGPGDLVSRFEQEMNKLRPMTISTPFRTQFGWHIVQVLERRKHDGTREVRRAQARKEIRERRINEDLEAWLRQLRDEAYVEYRLEG